MLVPSYDSLLPGSGSTSYINAPRCPKEIGSILGHLFWTWTLYTCSKTWNGMYVFQALLNYRVTPLNVTRIWIKLAGRLAMGRRAKFSLSGSCLMPSAPGMYL